MSDDKTKSALALYAARQAERAVAEAPKVQRVHRVPRAAAMLSDAGEIIAYTIRDLKSRAAKGNVGKADTQQLLAALEALSKTHELEKGLARELQLEQLDDAQLAAQARLALATLADDTPTDIHQHTPTHTPTTKPK